MSQIEQFDDDDYIQPTTPAPQVDPLARFRPGSRVPQRPLTPRKKLTGRGEKKYTLHVTWDGRTYFRPVSS